MRKFYYFLKDNPSYPEVIMAKDKNEVVSLLIESMGDHARDYIIKILTESEFTGKPEALTPTQNINNQNVNENGDFITNTLNMLSSNGVPESNEIKSPHQEQIKIQSAQHETKFFSAGGEDFKFENGKLYKKSWGPVENQGDFRIVKTDTLKPIKSEKYKIETLVWVETE